MNIPLPISGPFRGAARVSGKGGPPPAVVSHPGRCGRRGWRCDHRRHAGAGTAVRSAKAWPMVANTGSRWSSRQMRSTFATGGCGAMSARRHPARSAWLAIRTKALSPRASQKDRLVRSSSSSPVWPAMAQPRAARPSAVARSSSAGARTTAIAAPEPAGAWVAPLVMTVPPFAIAGGPPLSGSLCAGQDGTALSPQAGTTVPPGRVHHRQTNQCGPAAPADGCGTGPAGSDSRRRRPGGRHVVKGSHATIVGPRHAGKPSGSTHIRSGLSSTPCRANPVSPRSIAHRPASCKWPAASAASRWAASSARPSSAR
jgi:hypothetical protein